MSDVRVRVSNKIFVLLRNKNNKILKKNYYIVKII